MITLNDHFHAFLNLRKDGVRVAGEIGVADVKRPHITIIRYRPFFSADGGLAATRTPDLYRVKVAL